ncbi:high-affinity Zn(2+) transporter zrt1 [Mortierella hygrophila]|uniref:High-affinity Zn(2+) transporter zrt1 n=1 Tax=Mortierella hygrophila TaxID=979708 RepID=A0A9P6FB55_9FUNG|nr:high-affinity Zn(2+) transporter zrt1 [Mortierella hygrophila]
MADNSTDTPTVEDYNMGLHIGGLFANMAASALGVLLPILFAYTTFNAQTTTRIHSVIQTARTFGSGVILATAFIHMLPSAFSNLSDPSLPEVFQEDTGYTGWAGLIAMVSAMLLQLLEYTATQRFFTRSKKSGGDVHAIDRLSAIGEDDEKKRVVSDDAGSLEEGRRGYAVGAVAPVDGSVAKPEDCLHMGHVHGGEILLVNKNNKNQHQSQHLHPHGNGELSHNDHGHDSNKASSSSQQEQRSREIGTYILEFGIALHSVIIGITLATTLGTEFVSLLIALLFHQFFEGVALGGRIASLQFKRSSFRPWLLSAWFACSTPLGIAIGIGIRSSYEGDSVTALIVQGVFDSCSAGILLYTAMVQLMSTEINSNVAFRESSHNSQVVQFVALWCGAAAMAVVGKWA